MDWFWILLIVFGALAVLIVALLFIIGRILVLKICRPDHYSRDYCYKTDQEKGVLVDCPPLKRDRWNFLMPDGYCIHGDVSLQDPKKFIIFVHGYTWSREGGLKYVKYFYSEGYSVILYDQRGHGDNRDVATTMGYQEAKDLKEIIRQIREKYGKETEIALHGESMGAATALEVLKYERNLSFIVADSPYSSLRNLVKFQLGLMHLPSFLIPFSNFWFKKRFGFKLDDVSALDAVKDSHVPLLLLQGDDDLLVGKGQIDLLKDHTSAYCETYHFPSSQHTCERFDSPEEYEKDVRHFLENISRK